MENHDKIYKQFQDAAEKSEAKDFPAMESVWNRVEQKLDTTVLVKQNHLWKKIAVAASIVLVATLAFQHLNPVGHADIDRNQVVVADTIQPTIPLPAKQNEIVAIEQNTNIIPDAEKVLKQKINERDVVAAVDLAPTETVSTAFETKKEAAAVSVRARSSNFQTRKFSAIGVNSAVLEKRVEPAAAKAQIAQKDDPIVIINGKAQIGYGKSAPKTADRIIGQLSQDQVDEIQILTEPLYIVDGIRYSELELFGPNPTSPYSPLNQQEIETIAVLQNEKAAQIYGEAGKKGVVIITTKHGKPRAKSDK